MIPPAAMMGSDVSRKADGDYHLSIPFGRDEMAARIEVTSRARRGAPLFRFPVTGWRIGNTRMPVQP
jgi:hypothetical protein